MAHNGVLLTVLLALLAGCEVSRALLYAPPQPFTFATWVGANDSSWFQFPETASTGNHTIPALLQLPNLGISISGGGLRAATLGLGYLRALHQLNITARYLSANSGSVWLTMPYTFQQKVPTETFLGTTLQPEQLTFEQLWKQPPEGSFESVVAKANFTSRAAKGELGRSSTGLFVNLLAMRNTDTAELVSPNCAMTTGFQLHASYMHDGYAS
jgi:hypothetical protein